MPDSRRPAAKRPGASHAGISAIRARLGLPATASTQDVVNAAAAALQDGTHREMEALRGRVGLAAGATDQQVIDAAIRRLAPTQGQVAASQSPTRGATPGDVLDWATKTGRISASSRPMWERNWIADPVKTDALLRILAPVPSAAVPVAAATAQGRSEAAVAHNRPEVSALPARIQRAAARQSDPGHLARWQQRYAGMSDAEVSPEALMMDGEEWLFREVRRDEDEASFEAKVAYRQQFEANVNAQNRQIAADADYLREHDGRAWGVGAAEILARRPPQTPA